MRTILEKAKVFTGDVLAHGDLAVDATLGNGHDACHLAEQVGPTGHVYGIDVQPEAITSGRERVQKQGWSDRVTCIRGDHAQLKRLLPSEHRGHLKAVMFNLGYLPGGDHSLTTQPATTVRAVEAAGAWLAQGGRMTVVMYRGHAGGDEECTALLEHVSGWDQKRFSVVHYRFINRVNAPPELLLVEKL